MNTDIVMLRYMLFGLGALWWLLVVIETLWYDEYNG